MERHFNVFYPQLLLCTPKNIAQEMERQDEGVHYRGDRKEKGEKDTNGETDRQREKERKQANVSQLYKLSYK